MRSTAPLIPKRRRRGKPVVVYMDSPRAASGGYYVSCGGKYLMASEHDDYPGQHSGVIIQTLNYEQLLFTKLDLLPVCFQKAAKLFIRTCSTGARPITPGGTRSLSRVSL